LPIIWESSSQRSQITRLPALGNLGARSSPRNLAWLVALSFFAVALWAPSRTNSTTKPAAQESLGGSSA
jgi:hypothetical protein